MFKQRLKKLKDVTPPHSEEIGMSREGQHLSNSSVCRVWKITMSTEIYCYRCSSSLYRTNRIPESHFTKCKQFGDLGFCFSLLTFAYSFPLSRHFHLHSYPYGCTPHDYKCNDCCHTGNDMVTHREHSLKRKMEKQKYR